MLLIIKSWGNAPTNLIAFKFWFTGHRLSNIYIANIWAHIIYMYIQWKMSEHGYPVEVLEQQFFLAAQLIQSLYSLFYFIDVGQMWLKWIRMDQMLIDIWFKIRLNELEWEWKYKKNWSNGNGIGPPTVFFKCLFRDFPIDSKFKSYCLCVCHECVRWFVCVSVSDHLWREPSNHRIVYRINQCFIV